MASEGGVPEMQRESEGSAGQRTEGRKANYDEDVCRVIGHKPTQN